MPSTRPAMASPRPANLSEFLLIAPRAIPLKIIASSPKINASKFFGER